MQRIKDIFKPMIAGFLGLYETRLILPRTGSAAYCPIFIVGPPRSGSTLLYQLLTVKFRSCYFSNAMMRFPHSPVAISRLTAPFGACTPSNKFSSWYGNVPGGSSPSQGEKAWNRWLPTNVDYVDPDVLASESIDTMRRTIMSMQSVFSAPFISKWQRHSARVHALAHVFPECVFIRMTRDQTETVNSILRGRREFLGDQDAWLSVRPRACTHMQGKSPVEQVAEQVFYLEKEIPGDLDLHAKGRHITVNYGDLCSNTIYELNRISDWYQNLTGMRLPARKDIPSEFPRSHQQEDEQTIVIRSYLTALEHSNSCEKSE